MRRAAILLTLQALGCGATYAESEPSAADAGARSPEAGASASSGPSCAADLSKDVMNCGACGHVCPIRPSGAPSCIAGTCAVACDTNTGNCDGNDENGCETALTTDARNCGACSHDCEGAACKEGACDAYILAGGEGTSDRIALSDTGVFWVSGSSVNACPKSGCGGKSVAFMTALDQPVGIAVAGDRVYATSNTRVVACELGGCGVSGPSTIASALAGARGVAADTSAVYIAGGGAIGACPLAGCSGAPTSLVTSGATNTVDMVVSGGFLYWSEGYSPGGIWRYPIGPATASPQSLIGNLRAPGNLVVGATSIAFIEGSDGSGTVSKVPLGGAVVATPIATVNAYARGIAGDDTYIFVALDDSIVRIDRAKGTTKTLATGNLFARGIAVDAKAVYFTNREGVMKLVR